MFDPVLEILLDGTNTAERTGGIAPNEAARLRLEILEAAVLDPEPALSD